MIESICAFVMLPVLGAAFAGTAIVRLVLSSNPYYTQSLAALSILCISLAVVLVIDSEASLPLSIIIWSGIALGLFAFICSSILSMKWRKRPSVVEQIVRLACIGIASMSLIGGLIGYFIGRCDPQVFLPRVPQHELYIYE